MDFVKPKKSLGQHFLTDKNIAHKIVASLTCQHYNAILEIGPGTGVLTEILLQMKDYELRFIEIDKTAADHLHNRFPQIAGKLYQENILKADLKDLFNRPFAVIGNLPYNISSQIFFRILEYRDLIMEGVCMVQKEVGTRLASPPGSKEYGILSVLLGTYYSIEHLFHVGPQVFKPPPRVDSSVIRFTRNKRKNLECDDVLFFRVVKTAFNQRRKTLRNSLKSMLAGQEIPGDILKYRPEQLSVEQFIHLTGEIERINHIREISDC